MALISDIHAEIDWTGAGTFGGTYDDITALVIGRIQTFIGVDSDTLTGYAGPSSIRFAVDNRDFRFSPFYTSSVLSVTPTYVAAGAASSGNGVAPTPALPAGMSLGDYMICRVYSREATDGTIAISKGWRELYNERSSGGLLAVFGRVYQTGDAAPTFTLGGHAAGDDITAQIAAWRHVNTARPIGVKGTIATNGSAQNIGAIAGITLGPKGMLIVVGGKLDDWTSVATLAQTGMTFVEIGETSLTTGNDAGAVWDYGTVDAGTALAVSAKTFTVTGGANAAGKGVMFSLNPEILTRPGPLVRIRDGANVLAIGRLTKVQPSSSPNQASVAVIEVSGITAEASNMQIVPLVEGVGDYEGTLIAEALTEAGLDDSGIETGDVVTGPFGTAGTSLVSLLSEVRKLEDTGRGFLHEDQASYRFLYHSKSHRESLLTSLATFSDASSPPLKYEAVAADDWVGHIFNRAKASATPWTLGSSSTLATIPGPISLQPGESAALVASYPDAPVATWAGHLRDVYYGSNVPVHQSVTAATSAGFDLTPTITYPATVTPGDLLLLLFISELDGTITTAPSGWNTALLNYTLPAGNVNFGVFFKTAVGTEDGLTFAGPTIASARRSAWQIVRDTSFNGKSVDVEITPTPSTATSSAPDTPSITPSWGALKSMFLSVLVSTTDSTLWNTTTPPSGYTFGLKTISPNGYGLNFSYRAESSGVTSENPGAWTMSSSKLWAGFTIAIRGARSSSLNVSAATPNTRDGAFTVSYDSGLGGGVGQQDIENVRITGTPLVLGDAIAVQSDYLPSQDPLKGVGIRTFPITPELFATAADAQDFTEETVERYGERQPVMSMSYLADIDSTHYAAAIARKVGDRITLIANNSMGLGISEDFFIESISRSIEDTTHEVTYTLSPAALTDP